MVTVAVFLLFFISGCIPTASNPNPTPSPPPRQGEMEKDFTLQALDGESLTLGDHLGRPIVVSFFRPGCGPCQRQIAPLNSIHVAYHKTRNLLVLGVGSGTSTVIAAYVDNNAIQYPVVLDSARDVSRLYGVSGVPTTFFIDRQGRIVRKHVGLLSEESIVGYLEMIC